MYLKNLDDVCNEQVYKLVLLFIK